VNEILVKARAAFSGALAAFTSIFSSGNIWVQNQQFVLGSPLPEWWLSNSGLLAQPGPEYSLYLLELRYYNFSVLSRKLQRHERFKNY